MSTDAVTVQGDRVEATSPEGVTAAMPLADLLARLTPPRMDTGGVILPDGVKGVISRGPMVIWVHQLPPRVHSLRWIADGSKAPYGPGAKYETVRMALPYVVMLAVFGPSRRAAVQLTHRNECFFRCDPLTSWDDELSYPGLLNCSKFTPPNGNPLSWICTQHLNVGRFARIADINQRMRASFRALLACLFETAFNRSSEVHEGASWYSETLRQGIDERISTMRKWQKATRDNPLFATKVPWLPTGMTVRKVAERIFANHRVQGPAVNAASDLARIVFHHKRRAKK